MWSRAQANRCPMYQAEHTLTEVAIKKKTLSVQYALQWRLVGNRWQLVGNRWRLVGKRRRLVGNRCRLVGNRRRLVGNRWG